MKRSICSSTRSQQITRLPWSVLGGLRGACFLSLSGAAVASHSIESTFAYHASSPSKVKELWRCKNVDRNDLQGGSGRFERLVKTPRQPANPRAAPMTSVSSDASNPNRSTISDLQAPDRLCVILQSSPQHVFSKASILSDEVPCFTRTAGSCSPLISAD